MRNYKGYSADDFLNDDYFVQWVKFPDQETEHFWSAFIDEHPEKVQAIEEAKQFLKLFNDQASSLSGGTLQNLYDRINDRIDIPVSASTVHQIVNSRSQKNRKYILAAVVTIALLAFVSWWLIAYTYASHDSIQTVTFHEESTTKSHLKEHVIPHGKRSRVILEDGTQIWINAGSKLMYAPDYAKGPTRDVYLQGEAFFDVVSDESHPFIVHVQGVEIKALGTAFNVKGYEEDSRIETTLVHGKVSIGGDSVPDNVMLAPNQRAVFQKVKKDILVENNVETDTYTSWKQGVLVFDDQPLYEILPILERTFNVTIHTDEAHSLDCRFTAKINNKSLTEVLDLFRTSDTIAYSVVADNVYIKGSFCND